MDDRPCRLRVSTWNVAAVNNNPFEYHVAHDDPAYDALMAAVEALAESPGERDVPVGVVFPHDAMSSLCEAMRGAGFDANDVDATAAYYRDRIAPRLIVSGFLRDETLGAKRLCSMPDRVTNTIALANGDRACRPSVVNGYEPPLPDLATWWNAWRAFMFDVTLPLLDAKTGETRATKPCHLLRKITRAKYPATTETEERLSLPLQLTCLAVFDAVLVHVVNQLAPVATWHGVKTGLVRALLRDKTARACEILASPEVAASSADVVCLQEVSASMVAAFKAHDVLSAKYHVLTPEAMDGARDQNSVVLLAKERFDVDAEEWRGEDTAAATRLAMEARDALAPGDLFVVRCVERLDEDEMDAMDAMDGEGVGGARLNGRRRFVVASFHGDTNGLMTIPVVDALDKLMILKDVDEAAECEGGKPWLAPPPPLLIVGLDANTYVDHVPGKRLGVREFSDHIARREMATCWGVCDPRVHTTFNARTYLQPQLNKAVRMAERASSDMTDKNPKDHILFRDPALFDLNEDTAGYGTGEDPRKVLYVGQKRGPGFSCRFVSRDNTGRGRFVSDAPFPTMSFPSDHAIVTAELEMKWRRDDATNDR
jgi:hypothetical protein